MALHKRGGVWHYDFTVGTKRYRGSTKEKIQSKARAIESALLNEAKRGKLTGMRQSVSLAEISQQLVA